MKKIFLFLIIFILTCNSDNKTIDLNVRTFLQAQDVLAFDTEEYSKYKNFLQTIDIKKSALITIDIWAKADFLDPEINDLVDRGVKKKLIYLIDLARKMNLTIIHAPSQHPEIHPLISPEKNDIVVYGYKNLDKELYLRGIDTLFYAGFDSFKCVLDKPMGIFATYFRNSNFNFILIRDANFSRYESWKNLVINMIESNFGMTTSITDMYNAFGESPPSILDEPFIYDLNFKRDNGIDSEITIDKNKTALIIINSGELDNHPNDGYKNRINANSKNNISSLITSARNNNMLVIHSTESFGHADIATPATGEPVITNYNDFISVINNNNISKIFYTGFDLNKDILYGKTGIIRLYIRSRYEMKTTPEYIIVSDATEAFEIPENLPDEKFKEAALSYRDIKTVTTSQLLDAMN
jgi:nicotinamidase-related amidase